VDLETGRDCNTSQLEAKYANYFQTGHNAVEFLIEFGQSYAGDPEPFLHTRIITNPTYAKRLHTLLDSALKKYESEHGPIEEL
jgi:hypothetical protein